MNTNKHFYILIITFLFFISCVPIRTSKKFDNTFIIGTYNIRFAGQQDVESGNGWDIRKSHVSEVILSHQMDIVGTQEGSKKQLVDLKNLLKDYEYLSNPYGGKNGMLHNTAIFYKPSMFTLLDSGVFWLSPTPDIPSIGWDASDRRICQWGKFLHKRSGKEFYYFNTHFYWRGVTAKEYSGSIIVEKIKSIAGDNPVVLGGDLNSGDQSPQILAIKQLLNDSFDPEKNIDGGIQETAFPGGTFQGSPKAKIDYLFTNQKFSVESYEIGINMYKNVRGENTYPSDHLPVICKLSFK